MILLVVAQTWNKWCSRFCFDIISMIIIYIVSYSHCRYVILGLPLIWNYHWKLVNTRNMYNVRIGDISSLARKLSGYQWQHQHGPEQFSSNRIWVSSQDILSCDTTLLSWTIIMTTAARYMWFYFPCLLSSHIAALV